MTRGACRSRATGLGLTVLVALAAGPAYAAEAPQDVGAAPETARLIVTREQCLAAVRHTPRDDVAFTPGTDVEGRPVAPADLPGPRLQIAPESVTFTIAINIAAFLGDEIAEGLSDTSAVLGELSLQGQQVLFDGRPLSDPQAAAIAAACRAHMDRDGTSE